LQNEVKKSEAKKNKIMQPKDPCVLLKVYFYTDAEAFQQCWDTSHGICPFITDKNQRYMMKERDFGDQYMTFFVTGFGEGKYTNARTPTKTFFEERKGRDAIPDSTL
jgi:hypothetical protein